MAISVRDIQEKEFGTQAKGGYSVEEVDDFLDELAEQTAGLLKENLELTKRVGALEADLAAAQAAAAEAEKKIPDYNEKGYFDNLQKTIRETMIGAQRIADETTAEAEANAAQVKAAAQDAADDTIRKAEAEAERITGEAQDKLSALTEQYNALRAEAQRYKADFGSLSEDLTALLKEKTKLI